MTCIEYRSSCRPPDTLRLFHEKVRKQCKTIDYNYSDLEMVVFGDERLLRQVVVNLVSNAMKFAGDNCDTTISIRLTKDGEVETLAADNGIGLPITKALVEMHQDSFSIDSRLGKGTTVRFTRPPDRPLETAAGELGQTA